MESNGMVEEKGMKSRLPEKFQIESRRMSNRVADVKAVLENVMEEIGDEDPITKEIKVCVYTLEDTWEWINEFAEGGEKK